MVPAAVVVSVIESFITGREGAATVIATALALTAIPVAIGVAVMRYRLYEIDRLINRTLVYVTLTVGLAATFAAVSLTLGVAIGSGSTLPTAAARSRSRWCSGRCARARRVSWTGASIGRDTRACGRSDASWRICGPAAPARRRRARCWPRRPAIRPSSCSSGCPPSEVHVDAFGRAVDELPSTGGAHTPVRRGELQLATVVHDMTLDERPDLLESVIEAAGLAIEIARLRVRCVAGSLRSRSPRPHCHRRLRGATPARARPPRRRPTAARLDRARAAPRAGPAPDTERGRRHASTPPSRKLAADRRAARVRSRGPSARP